MDNKTDETIEQQAREYLAFLNNTPAGGVSGKKMAEIIRFLKKHKVAMENPDHA